MKSMLLFFMVMAWSGFIFAQEVPFFEVAENEPLGLTPVLVDRYGCSSADIDRNGWPDIFSSKWRGVLESQIYMNDNGYFTDIYANSPDLKVAEHAGNSTRTPVLVDFDNDGDRDLMLGTDYFLFMFRNDDNVFVDITDQLGIVSSKPGQFVSAYGYEMSAWIDWDLDGDLDALVAQTNNPDYIFYRNDGNQFVDIATDVGLAGQNELGNNGDRGLGTGRIQWIDWDSDGDPDLSAGHKLFRNEDGYLTEVSEQVGFLPYNSIRFHNWFDYDLDGDWDFMLQGDGNRDEIWENEGGTFVDATQETTLDLFTDNSQSTLNVGDFDNDGDEDCFFSINDWEDIEAFLLNVKEGDNRYFLEVAQFAGFNLVGDRKGAVILDYDMDGKLDIFSPSVQYGSLVYHNLGTETPRNWIGLDLWGTTSNKDALGALVLCYVGEMKLMRYLKAAQTWKIQDNPYVHFGIDQATSVDSIVIHWPMGTRQVLTDLAINQYHKVEESGGTGVEIFNSAVPKAMALAQNYPNPFNPTTQIEYDLSKASDVTLIVYDVTGREVTTLVNGHKPAGSYTTSWDGRDNSGNLLSTGIYVYRLQAGDFIATKKMVFVQ